MASCGFYDIRTFECLSRDYNVTQFGYDSLFKEETEKDDEQAANDIKDGKQMNKR